MTKRTKTSNRQRRAVSPLAWAASVVVPLVLGGIVGGQLGGIVAAAIVIPWFDHLVRRSHQAQFGPERRGPVSSVRPWPAAAVHAVTAAEPATEVSPSVRQPSAA